VAYRGGAAVGAERSRPSRRSWSAELCSGPLLAGREVGEAQSLDGSGQGHLVDLVQPEAEQEGEEVVDGVTERQVVGPQRVQAEDARDGRDEHRHEEVVPM